KSGPLSVQPRTQAPRRSKSGTPQSVTNVSGGSGSDLAWIGHDRRSLTGQEQTYSWRFRFSLKRPVACEEGFVARVSFRAPPLRVALEQIRLLIELGIRPM